MRQPRKLEKGARYHIIARVNRRELILDSGEMKLFFLDVVKKAKDKYDFSVINFCIMGNHVHFIIRPGEKENLSDIMRWILSVFAMRYNRLHNVIGHVWYDRFKSVILGDIRQFLKTFLYIMENPVKAGIVKHAEEFEHNGIWYLKRRIYGLIEPPDIVLRLLLPGICETSIFLTA